MTQLVVVTVGTDHHPFDRLIRWMQEWAETNPNVRCVIQHGYSRAPDNLEGFQVLARCELIALMARATVVVTQGGPGSILDARGCGLVPIAVPRRASLGEVVDDHQVPFAKHMERNRQCLVAESRTELFHYLERALAHPDEMRRPAEPSPAPATAARISEVITALSDRPPGFVSVRRVRQMVLGHRYSISRPRADREG